MKDESKDIRIGTRNLENKGWMEQRDKCWIERVVAEGEASIVFLEGDGRILVLKFEEKKIWIIRPGIEDERLDG
jgi:hypothetical protein